MQSLLYWHSCLLFVFFQPGDDDLSEDVNDPAYLRSVLENLPGVDPQNEDIQKAIGSLVKKDDKDKPGDKDAK